MPMLVGILVILAACYQMFFRYEHWPSRDKEGVFYEHDNLTGDTYKTDAKARTSVFARIIGAHDGDREDLADRADHREDSDRDSDSRFLDNMELNRDEVGGKETERQRYERIEINDGLRLEKASAPMPPVPIPHEVVVASSAPPVPMAMLAADIEDRPISRKLFAIRQVDLNRDGDKEEIIQNAAQSDGVLDISIVRSGREIFFARGRQIALLPSRSKDGWTDITLKTPGNGTKIYRYNVKDETYKALQ